MSDLVSNIALKSSDRIVLLVGAIILIGLVLLIMYKFDNIPEDYTKKKKHNFKTDDEPEIDEDLEDQSENDEELPESRLEEIFQEEKPEINSSPINAIGFDTQEEDSTFSQAVEETNDEIGFGNLNNEYEYIEQSNDPITFMNENTSEEVAAENDIFSNTNNTLLNDENAINNEVEEPISTIVEEPVAPPTKPARKTATKKDVEIDIFADSNFGATDTIEEEPIEEPKIITDVIDIEEEKEETTSDDFSMFT